MAVTLYGTHSIIVSDDSAWHDAVEFLVSGSKKVTWQASINTEGECEGIRLVDTSTGQAFAELHEDGYMDVLGRVGSGAQTGYQILQHGNEQGDGASTGSQSFTTLWSNPSTLEVTPTYNYYADGDTTVRSKLLLQVQSACEGTDDTAGNDTGMAYSIGVYINGAYSYLRTYTNRLYNMGESSAGNVFEDLHQVYVLDNSQVYGTSGNSTDNRWYITGRGYEYYDGTAQVQNRTSQWVEVQTGLPK